MSSLDEAFSRQFREWEMRGRGGRLYDQPVALEPPFVPFFRYERPRQRVDDGRRSTALNRFWNALTAPEPPPEVEEERIQEPGPYYRFAEQCAELQLTLPESKPLSAATHLGWLHEVCRAGEPLTFELLGTAREIVPQFVGNPDAMERIYRALPQYVPDLMMLPRSDALHSAWSDSAPRFAAVTLGLGSEFIIPLRQAPMDLLSTIVHAMDGLRDRELALYQILIEPVVNGWAECIPRAITTASGKPIFSNRPELVPGAERKLTSPFLAVVVRLAACADSVERCWRIILDMAGPLSALTQRGSNYLIPLSNDGYAPVDQEEDILSRTSRRTGMLLNAEELIPLISLPTGVTSRRLRRVTAASRPAPVELVQGGSLLLGENSHGGRTASVWLSPSHRVRHMHVLGASGTGKSTLLLNLIRQDIENGEGIAVLDPHGDLIDAVLGLIPWKRVDDVVLVDPSDEDYVVGFNILAAHSDFERNLLASDLVSVFRRLSTSWGEQMNSVLRNAILAFLESSRGGTLADLRRFLLDQTYRQEFLGTVTDPEIVFYWQQAFPQLSGNKSIGPVLTRLDEFLSRKPIRYMVAQQENRLDFADILDRGRILLVKLSQGQLGRENANLLGSLMVSKIQQTAMSRQRMPEAQRRDFWVYLDEFHSFITPSMAEILTGARKYRVGLILAHQELHQLDIDRDVASAVLANCGTRVVFRVSDKDARELDSGFAHFVAADLQNLDTGKAICRVGRSEADFNLTVPAPEPPDGDADNCREAAIEASRQKYARPRDEAAKIVAESLGVTKAAPKQEPAKPSPTEAPERSHPVDPERGDERESVGVPLPLPQFGRGGEEHRDIQQEIKRIAQNLGFRVVGEQPVLGGAGYVDVSLEAENLKVACEVAVTNAVADEVENVRKCLAAGYGAVISVATEKGRLVTLAQSYVDAFSEAEAKRVHVCPPRGLGALLKKLLRQNRVRVDEAAQAGGYRIKRKYANDASDDDALKSEAEFLRLIGQTLRGE